MRTFFYFLLYPVLGPPLGFAFVTALFSILEGGYYWQDLPEEYFWLIVAFAYVIGVVAALMVGIAAGFQFSRYGKSKLVINISIAVVSSLLSSLYVASGQGWPFFVLAMLAGAFAATVLRGIEPLFHKSAQS